MSVFDYKDAQKLVQKEFRACTSKGEYEFVDFYAYSKVNFLEFSKPGSYTKLQRLWGKAPGEHWSDEDRAGLSTAYYYFRQAYEAKGGKKLTSTVGDAILHYPALKDNVSTTVSPMCAVSRMLKQKDPETVTVFIGPCIAKKSEAKDLGIKDNADYAMTYGEIRSLMYGKGIELEPEENIYQASSVYGKRFGDGGGVTAAVVQCFQEMGEDINPNVMKCSGAAECKKALLLMKAGKLPADFIEGMACEGGCVGGPSRNMEVLEAKKFRDNLIGQADDRKILENLQHLGANKVPMRRG